MPNKLAVLSSGQVTAHILSCIQLDSYTETYVKTTDIKSTFFNPKFCSDISISLNITTTLLSPVSDFNIEVLLLSGTSIKTTNETAKTWS